MSETSLPPPTKNSHGPLITGVLLLLLALGGFFAWKAVASRDRTNQEVVEPPATAATTLAVPPAPPPPPPEPEEEPSAAPDVTPAPKVTSVAPPPRSDTGCSGTCTGSADATLRSALRQRGGSAKGCYDKALRTKPTLQGKLMVGIRISPNGTVCSASVVSDSLGDPGVRNCILQNFRAASYPKPSGGCVDVQVPLNLIPSAQ